MSATVSGAVMFTQRLLNVSTNLTFAGDVLEVGNLLFRTVNLLTNHPDLYEPTTYAVNTMLNSLVSLNCQELLYDCVYTNRTW